MSQHHTPAKPGCRGCQLQGLVPFTENMPPHPDWTAPEGSPAQVEGWSIEGMTPTPVIQVTGPKPRMSISELARKRKRCVQAKAAGQPCTEFTTPPVFLSGNNKGTDMRWACGLTTVPERFDTYLPGTLTSLKLAGFPDPRLFVDGARDTVMVGNKFPGYEVTTHWPAVRTFGNWVLGLWEIYVRDPGCGYYAMFQDDFVCVKGLREYLGRCEKPSKGYFNLYTFQTNEPMIQGKGAGWHEAGKVSGPDTLSGPPQSGRGAVALVFPRDAVVALLSSEHMAIRPQDVNRGWKAIDGGIVSAMNKAGYREFIHSPSLTQHTGEKSSMGNRTQRQALTFPGEEFDALSLLTSPAQVS